MEGQEGSASVMDNPIIEPQSSLVPIVDDRQEGSASAMDNPIIEPQSSLVPIVDDHVKPHVGMTFNSLEEAEEFYRTYGRVGLFEVRNSSTKYVKGELVSKYFVCSKAGEQKKQLDEVEEVSGLKKVRRGGSVRTNCNALIWLKLHKERGVWVISKFNEVHNHGLTSPRRMHLLPGNRIVSKAKKVLMNQFNNINIPTHKQMAFFESCSGGFNKIGCTERDIRNVERDLREELRGFDAQMLIEYFSLQQYKNPSFFYKYETDENNRLTHCFWLDDIGRVNAKHFGDVVSFDATHNTNRHGLVFVAFVGNNYHWQSVFLGCGLIPNEETKSFVWIFERWLEVTGHPPLGMVTDQDLGIGGAIKIVFPQMHHRYCIWHILDKVPKKLKGKSFDKEFSRSFYGNIYDAESITDFEAKWKAILNKYDLGDDKWLNEIYGLREKWVPIYNNTHFWAGMSSSQRSEGMNSFLKKHTAKKTSLHEFVFQFERVLARQREEELKEDHRTLELQPKLKTLFPMEKQMSQVYTLKIFFLFQKELCSSMLYNVVLVEDNGSEEIYCVKLCGNAESNKFVKYCKLNQMASCSCLMFEFKGIPCKHLLAFLKYLDQSKLPEQYVVRRWCRDVKGKYVGGGGKCNDGVPIPEFASRFAELTHLANQVADEGVTNDEIYELARNNLCKTIEEIHCLKRKQSDELNEKNSEASGKGMKPSKIMVLEPLHAKTKGRPSGKRWKPIQEQYKGRPRTCNACGMKKVLHDSRNCPKRVESETYAQEVDCSTGDSEDDTSDNMN